MHPCAQVTFDITQYLTYENPTRSLPAPQHKSEQLYCMQSPPYQPFQILSNTHHLLVYWHCFKGSAGETSETGRSAYGLFRVHIRSWTELNCTLEAMTTFTSPLSVPPDLRQQETSERQGGAHMGFSQCTDTILNWTELYTRSNEHVHLTSEISASMKLLTDGVEHIWAFLSA